MRERCRRNEKCAGNLLRGQAADFAKSERNLPFRRQSRMAAGEDQTEAIIFDLLVIALFIMQRNFVDACFTLFVDVERNFFPETVGARV